MRTLLKFFKQLFWNERDWQEHYLAGATDHADLERRIRQLDRGEVKVGPFGAYQSYKYF
jgi:hypothetical protein